MSEADDLGAAIEQAREPDEFRPLVARALALHGAQSNEYCAALEGLATALVMSGSVVEAREIYGVVADVLEVRAEASGDELDLARAFDMRALSLVMGVGTEEASALVPQIDALVARAESETGLGSAATLGVLSRRAELLLHGRRPGVLDAYDLLIARAGQDLAGPENQLMALAEKARALSLLDRDEESALLWQQVRDGRREILGATDPTMFEAWDWYARTLYWAGDANGATRELEQYVPALAALRGNEDPAVRDSMRVWAAAARGTGKREDFETGLRLVRSLLAIDVARFGGESDEVIQLRTAEVDLLVALERFEEARDAAGSLIIDARVVLGPESALLLQISRLRQEAFAGLAVQDPEARAELRTIAIQGAEERCRIAEGQLASAGISALEGALADLVWWAGEGSLRAMRAKDRLAALQGEAPEKRARALRDAAQAQLDRDRPGAALALYGFARQVLEGHPGRGMIATDLGIAACHARMGHDRKAQAAYDNAMRQAKHLHPADPELVVKLLRGKTAREAAPALEAATIAAEAARELLAVDHPMRLLAEDDLASTLYRAGRHREARAIYRHNLPRMRRVLDRGSAELDRAETRGRAAMRPLIIGTWAIVAVAMIAGLSGAVIFG